MFHTFSRFFRRLQESKRRRSAARCERSFRAGFKPRVELLEQRVMLSASTLSFTGPAYSQNFDGLPNTGADQAIISTFNSSGPFDAISPTSGSTVDTGANPQGLGAQGMAGWSIAEYSRQTLSDFISPGVTTTGGVYDFGTASGAANRALGLTLTNGNSPEFGLTLVNNSGATLTQLTISFTAEQWTENTGNQELDFYYGTTATALPLSSSTLGFTQDTNLNWATSHTAASVMHVDGTSPTFQQGLSDTIYRLNWTNGSTLVLLWRELNSGNSAAMAIDNFSFSAVAAVPPPLLNEIETNPPGTDDNRYEYVELSGTAGASLNDIYLVAFDGISTNDPGTADLVVDLSPYSLGSNGLLVVKSASGSGPFARFGDDIGHGLLLHAVRRLQQRHLVVLLVLQPQPFLQRHRLRHEQRRRT